MSRAKTTISNESIKIMESKVNLIERIKGETLQGVALYLRNRNINFNYLPNFLKIPTNYPGNSNDPQLITEKVLKDVISKNYFKIQQEDMQIKFVYDEIMRIFFGGKR